MLKRPPRETLTPRMIQKVVGAGTRDSSFATAAASVRELAECTLSAKQVRRLTLQAGRERVAERRRQVTEFTGRTLMERTSAKPGVQPPEVGVLMLDNGLHQRRDHFGEPDRQTHWKQETGGLVLSMTSAVHAEDPCPDMPAWLFEGQVVREIANLAGRRESRDNAGEPAEADEPAELLAASEPGGFEWTPRLLARDVIASTAGAGIARHLECVAWERGITAAPRQAFVGDGASVIWNIHQRYFSQMTPILDLMHALSYAWRAAMGLQTPGVYRRWAQAIWQGRVRDVLAELREHQTRLGPPCQTPASDDPRECVARAITYYEHHQSRMAYPAYRRQGLPITSSLMESAIKQLNQRVKGTEKYWTHQNVEAMLQLRADALSDSQPLPTFWTRRQTQITGSNRYRSAS